MTTGALCGCISNRFHTQEAFSAGADPLRYFHVGENTLIGSKGAACGSDAYQVSAHLSLTKTPEHPQVGQNSDKREQTESLSGRP